MAVFSFHPVKIITTGEGGMILTNREDLYKKNTRLKVVYPLLDALARAGALPKVVRKNLNPLEMDTTFKKETDGAMEHIRNGWKLPKQVTIDGKTEDFDFYKKMSVPTPEMCPECRQQARMLFRNFKTLYKRKCDKSGKDIISMYDPEAPFPVYGVSEWWGDGWHPEAYAMDIDWNIPFFTQLSLKTP